MTIKKGLGLRKEGAVAVSKALLFIPLAKIDETERTVTGIMTAEILDKAGETFHYESSVPYFKAWSTNFELVTKGKSKGNVRSMHQPKAVGKLVSLTFDDGNKCITATAKIVDESEWQKCVEGIYTGFSIGGNYIKQWEEGGKNYFTADPVEVSIVDNPCVPVAHFSAVKADGVTEERPFKLYVPTNEEIAKKATELAGDKNWTDFIDPAREALMKEHGLKATYVAEAGMSDDDMMDDDMSEEDKKKKKKKAADGDEPAVKAGDKPEDEDEDEDEDVKKGAEAIKQVWLSTDGETFDKKVDCVTHQVGIDAGEDPIKKALASANAKLDGVEKTAKPYGDVAYAFEKDGVSMYPVDSELHIRASWVFANKSTTLSDDERKATLEKIKAAWTEKVGGEPPTLEQMDVFLSMKDGESAAQAVKTIMPNPIEVQKSFWVVGMWCGIVDQILCASDCVDWHHSDSELPQVTKDICAAILTFMIQLVTAEVAHSMAYLDKEARPDVEKLEGFTKWLATQANAIAEKLVAPPVDTVEKSALTKLEEKIAGLEADGVKKDKQLADAVEGIGALTARMQKFLDTPQPRPMLGRVVDKVTDRTGLQPAVVDDEAAMKEMLEKMGSEGVAKLMIRISQKNPISSMSTR